MSTLVALTALLVNRRSQEDLAFRTRLWDKQIELYMDLIQYADRAASLRRPTPDDVVEFVLDDEDQKLRESLSARVAAIASEDVIARWEGLAEVQWTLHFAVRNRKFERSAKVQEAIDKARTRSEVARAKLVDQIRDDLSVIKASKAKLRRRWARLMRS
jgi:hypothetical protein